MRRKLISELKDARRRKIKMAKVQQRLHFKKKSLPKKLASEVKERMIFCAICGEREATTRDHVPPKAIFPKPRPHNLITVPACMVCNNGASDYDDLFKVYLSMHTAENSEIAKKLFIEKTASTLQRNQALLKKVLAESKEINIVNKNGEIETRTGVLWDSEAHDAVIERIIRGLYYHHVGRPIPKDTELKVQWLRYVPKEIQEKIRLYTEFVIGESQFVYKYLIYQKDPRQSFWLFEFYSAHWASGYTIPNQA